MKCLVTVAAAAAVVAVASAQRAADNKNCKKPDGLFPHDQYCDYYYDCQNGEAVLQTCPNGLAFAGKKKGLIDNCDYPFKVGCPDEDNRVMGQSPESTENCHWKFGIFAHATSCTRYWQCWNGTATNQQCPFSLLFNDNAHACDWPDNVPDCQKHPICKDVANGPIPIEKSCARYWLCVGGYPRLQRCSAGLAFNADTLKCELADTVAGCEPPPQAADSEEQDQDSGTKGRQPPPRTEVAQPRPVQQSRPQPRPQATRTAAPATPASRTPVSQTTSVPTAPAEPAFRPSPQQFRPAAPAAQTEAPEYEYEEDPEAEAPTTQRPRRRNQQFGK